MKPIRIRHYHKDAAALGYVRGPAEKINTVTSRAMDAHIAKGELLKANIAKMREELKRKY